MAPTLPNYRAYLLRLWRASEARWWASLEDAHTGQRRTFATLAQLVAFLEAQARDPDPGEPAAGADPET
jgi:hypothetical protein